MQSLTSVYIVFLLALNACSADSDCAININELPHNRLKKDLFCDYDPSQRPVVNYSTPVVVKLVLQLKYITYDQDTHSIALNGWMVMGWTDEHLKWDPSNYNQLSLIRLYAYNIWTPDISIFNRNDESGSPEIIDRSIKCIVNSNGRTSLIVPVKLTALCMPNLEKFPFDKQNCYVKIASMAHSDQKIDLELPKDSLKLDNYVRNEEWKLIQAVSDKVIGNFSFPSVIYTVEIERHSATRATAILIPGLVMITLSLITLWMKPDNSDRLGLALINLICHFTYLESMSWSLPSSGDKAPFIIFFARDSLLLCGFSVLLTVILRAMVTAESSSPNWMCSVVKTIVSNRPGQIFLLSDANLKGLALAKGEDDTLDFITDSKRKNVDKDWILFAKLLDRLSFIAFFIVYVRMFVYFLL